MVGSSQNIALANIVLNTAVAKSFSDFADILGKAKDFEMSLDKLIADTFRAHRRILFSGNSYSKEWEEEARARGLSCFKSAPEAYEHFTDEKNIELFTKFAVMNEVEMRSRREIFFETYRNVVGIEARTMLEMSLRDYIPAVSKYVKELSEALIAKREALRSVDTSVEESLIGKLSDLLSKAYSATLALEKAEAAARAKETDEQRAMSYKDVVLPKMEALRRAVDGMEVLTAREYWPVPTYGDLTYRV
jgi:glutamine synthetase